MTSRLQCVAACLATALSGAARAGPVEPGADAEPTSDVQRPLWELGLGVAGLRLPDYRGSDRSGNYVLPLPYLVYRGTWLKADRDGARALLVDTPRLKVDVSVAATTPARSRDNPARAGMPNLSGTAEVGPNLNLTLASSPTDHWKLDLRLPLRAAITIERAPEYVGTTFSPNLNLDLGRVGGGWNLGLQSGPVFADRKYHAYYYSVDPADATTGRPVYRARGGYGGWQALASTSRRFAGTWVGAFLRYDRLQGAVFDDSPLVRRHSALSFGFGVSRILATSSELVSSPD
jgi:outer membrane scaffolding protein for murein synthesis (MipA/OmpV family)